MSLHKINFGGPGHSFTCTLEQSKKKKLSEMPGPEWVVLQVKVEDFFNAFNKLPKEAFTP